MPEGMDAILHVCVYCATTLDAYNSGLALALPRLAMSTVLTGAQLRAIRALRNITQATLAGMAGVSTNAIAEYEQGKRDLRADTIRKLCDALGVQVVYRVDGTEITGT